MELFDNFEKWYPKYFIQRLTLSRKNLCINTNTIYIYMDQQYDTLMIRDKFTKNMHANYL